MLNVTSGTWMTPEYSDRYVWSHQLLVVVPDTIDDHTHAALYITGGSNGQGNPKNTSEDVLFCSVLAAATNTVCGVLWQIPNQDITFPTDPIQPPKRRGEDDAVAFTWWDFLRHQDEPERILYFPMTRAASRAMDAIAEFAPKKDPASKIDKFLVSGASKRGFITWFAAATDSRVVAAAPIVMDLLNTEENIMHLYEDYGGFSFAFEPYCALNLTTNLGNGGFAPLAHYIDPLNYKENLTMPKLVIDATGDEFFALDDDHYWWGMLDGETKRLMVPNAEHSMATGVIPLITGLDAFYQSIVDGSPRPDTTWTMANTTGIIDFVTPTKPDSVLMWFSQTLDGKRRDFRLVRGDTPADPCVSPGIPVHIFGDGEPPREATRATASALPAAPRPPQPPPLPSRSPSQRASFPSCGLARRSASSPTTRPATTTTPRCPPPASGGAASWWRATGPGPRAPRSSSPRRCPSCPRRSPTASAPSATACSFE